MKMKRVLIGAILAIFLVAGVAWAVDEYFPGKTYTGTIGKVGRVWKEVYTKTLYFYNTSTGYRTTITGNATAARTLTMPDATGTLALTSSPSSLIPTAAGTYDLGSATIPWRYLYVGASSDTARIGGSFSADRTITIPDASITLNGITSILCGTTAACGGTDSSTSAKFYYGAVAMVGGSQTVTGLGFANTSYVCTATNAARASAVYAVPASASTLTLSGNATVGPTDTVNYLCVGI